MKKNLLVTSLAMAMAGSTWAGSFQLNLQGTRQTAMASSGTAYAWDVSTLFFNPAGLSSLNGLQAYASGYLVSPSVGFSQYPTAGYQVNAKRQYSTPFSAFVGGTVSKNKKLGLGLGVYTPFGSSLDWGSDWMGRYLVQDISLQTIYFQPTVSYKFSETFSAGVGVVYGIGNVNINRALPLTYADGSEGAVNLEGNAQGWGFNAGFQYKPTNNFSIGLNYRHGNAMKVNEGTATFRVPNAVSAAFPANGTTGFNTELKLPHILTLGFAYQANAKLTLQSDLVFAFWKRYDRLAFNFDENTASVKNTVDYKYNTNTFAVRVGANYKVIEELELMAGFAYDPTPTSKNYLSPDAVDGNRFVFSAGIAYTVAERLSIMAACQYTTIPTRDAMHSPSNFRGAYQVRSLTPSLGIAYKF